MNANQRRRRIVFWRGSFPVIVGFAVLILTLTLAEQAAPVTPQELDGVNLSQQVVHSPKLGSQTTAPILAVSQ